MTFYHLSKKIGLVLEDILNKICHEKYNNQINNIAVTWINYNNNSKKGYGYGINNNKKIYPASLVKLVYGLAIYSWIENKVILYDQEVNDATFKMLQESSNDATSFIVDLLTGTNSGTSLEGEDLVKWQYQRGIINDWLKDLNWEELHQFNCCQKTWEDSPYGREKDFYGTYNENRNSVTTDGIGKIMEEIMHNLKFNENNINLKNCLRRELTEASIKQNSENQIKGFIGEGLPKGNVIWSKAGLMSEVRHDAAYWINQNGSKTLLVACSEGKDFSSDEILLPSLSKEIYNYINRNSIPPL